MLLPRNQLLQDFFGIFEALGDLCVVSYKLISQVVRIAVALFVNVGDVTLIGGQKHFRVIVEHDLDSVITETEEDSMLGSNPFLEIDERLSRTRLVASSRPKVVFLLRLLLLFDQIVPEVFQESNLLLQLAWILRQSVRDDNRLATTNRVLRRLLSFDVLEAFPVRLKHSFG
jgi:hypothetical protein